MRTTVVCWSSLFSLFLMGGLPGCTGDTEKPKDDPEAEAVDEDGDGYGPPADCNDADDEISPGATEICDGADNDCDGEKDEVGAEGGSLFHADEDGDGVGSDDATLVACEAPEGWLPDGGDCDDFNDTVGPDALELCNGLDDDCDGQTDEEGAADGKPAYWDEDGDGSGNPDEQGAVCEFESPWVSNNLDCDDDDPEVWGGNIEVCDNKDNDCDGEEDNDAIDGTTYYADDDGDGDGDPASPVTACRKPSDYVSNDDDCDDTDDDVHEGEREICNGIDDDCDGEIDADAWDAETWYADADADGYGDPDSEIESCEDPYGAAMTSAGDCDDGDADVNPAAEEIWYDGLDEDCGGDSDWDQDADGYVEASLDDEDEPTYNPGSGEIVDDGSSTFGGDCDDDDDSISPAETELCDDIDQDCDGELDEDASDAISWYPDSDRDGYGVSAGKTAACDQPEGRWSRLRGDCDGDDPAVSPGADEIWYDGVDTDCRSDSDWDQDGDGYVSADLSDADIPTYDPGTGEIVEDGSTTLGGDCEDTLSSVHPDASESCDGEDEDCDGEIDEDAVDGTTWYADADADGYGGDSSAVFTCDRPGSSYGRSGGDCNDDDPDANPGVEETWYDGWDSDCAEDSDFDQDADGYVLEGLADPDASTYTPGTSTVVDDGSSTASGDCDDEEPAAHPSATERCDSVDNDCDGIVDLDARGAETYYTDADGDGYGADDSEVVKCSRGSGYVTLDGDCDDAESDVNPGETEICDDDDGLDNDCDSYTDPECNTGWLRYEYAYSDTAEDRSCDLVWSAEWSTSSESHSSADWTFDVALTYEPSLSDNTGGCVDETDADLSWTMSLDYRARSEDRLYQMDGADWTLWDDGEFNDDSGRLDFNTGSLEDLDGDGYYLTDYWSGVAELYELTR